MNLDDGSITIGGESIELEPVDIAASGKAPEDSAAADPADPLPVHPVDTSNVTRMDRPADRAFNAAMASLARRRDDDDNAA